MIDGEAIRETIDREFDCSHDFIAPRRKVASNGVVHYFHQCLRCGQNRGAIKHSQMNQRVRDQVEDWDDGLQESWWRRRSQRWSELREGALADEARSRELEDSEWWTRYNTYLESPAWKERRRMVLERAKGVCEGCRSRPAVQVHHLTYVRVFNEMLFDLVAVCRECHGSIHGEKEKESNGWIMRT